MVQSPSSIGNETKEAASGTGSRLFSGLRHSSSTGAGGSGSAGRKRKLIKLTQTSRLKMPTGGPAWNPGVTFGSLAVGGSVRGPPPRALPPSPGVSLP